MVPNSVQEGGPSVAFRIRRVAALVAAAVLFSTTWPAIGVKPLAAEEALSDPATFIKGVDISTLQAIEEHGGKFYDGGVERDLLDILRDRGVNYVRVRVWNNPVEAGGYNDAAHLVALAQRVKAKGFGLLVDFHYSDFWADPGRQTKPAAWASLSFEQLKQAVYDYTAEVLSELRNVGAYPDMVQVGNEINNGILHPDGAASNFGNLAQLLAEGIRAVRDTAPPGRNAKVVLHLANGGNNAQFRWFFDNAVNFGLDFDVIGVSYYPYWHGSFQDLKNNLNDLAVRYGKEIAVVETAYPYTLADCDGWENAVRQRETDAVGFAASVESQRLMLLTVMNTVAHVAGGKGLGVFYWEPAWIPVPSRSWDGVGWKSGEGNAWENQAMFDCDGNALPSLDAFRFLPGDLDERRPIGALPAPGVTTVAHEVPALPAAVDVLYDDGSVEALPVAWDAVDPDLLSRIGSFVLGGTVEGTGLRAKIGVTVVPSANRVVNPGFEDGWTPVGWNVSGDTAAVKIDGNAGNPHTGNKALNYWFGSPFAFTLSQTVTGLRNGQKYVLRGWVMGPWPGDGSPQPTVYRMFARDYGGPPLSVELANAGWPNWQPFEIRGIVPQNGQVTIGFDVQAPGGAWGFIDDVELREDVTVPSWPQDARLSVTSVSPESVRLEWTPAADESGVVGYKLYMDGRRIATVSGDTYGYTVTGLAPGSTHAFKVEAGNAFDLWTSTGPSATATLPFPASSPAPSPSGGTLPVANGGDENVLTVTPNRLEPSDRSKGPWSVVLPDSLPEARLTPEALAAIAGNGLRIRARNVTLVLPSAVLRRAADESASLAVRIRPVAAGTDYRMNGPGWGTVSVYDDGTYAVELTKWSADGRAVSLDTFAEPVELRLKPSGLVSSLGGIYRIKEGRAVEYVGGRRTSDGEIAAFVRESGTYALLEVRPALADVTDGHWAYEAVLGMVAKGFAEPAAVDGFMPERPVTRAEFVEWLVRALRIGEESGGATVEPFADVPREASYARAVAAARTAGIVEGKENGMFAPDQTLTREETAALLVRAVKAANVGTSSGGIARTFTDMADVAPWAVEAVRAAADAGLFEGGPAGRFEPKRGMTRAEAAQVLWRLYRSAEW